MPDRPWTHQELAARATVLVELLERLPALAADADLNPGVLAVTAAVDQMYRQVVDAAAAAPDLLVAIDTRIQDAQRRARNTRREAAKVRRHGADREAGREAYEADSRAELYDEHASELQQLRSLIGGEGS